ncbi:hypothetical protein SJS82_06720 [Aeromonas media]|uniref:Uncharacterized protein n=1 Tax=Aeromonas media TaxID=651 RepID=A0AAP6GAK5_AERME|nr:MULTISPECIES: hypothetical protein [Aeromonas]MDX7735371.1 hypothetical protein [Aeromonas caviae]MDX7921621.1 hypothetical protein [Aeromonas media]QUM02962.1 hypothetical protein IMO17_08005 [Aeromonas caviae]
MLSLQDLPSFIGPVIAAIIAGSISFIVTVLSKDQKTSEFRQTWIDSLRSEISELLSSMHIMSDVVNNKRADGEDEKEIKKYLYDKHEEFVKINTLLIKIKLRLNTEEHKDILLMLTQLDEMQFAISSSSDVGKKMQEITTESQRLLKKEWKRVKSGELSFRFLKWGSLLIFLSSALCATLFISEHLTITYTL